MVGTDVLRSALLFNGVRWVCGLFDLDLAVSAAGEPFLGKNRAKSQSRNRTASSLSVEFVVVVDTVEIIEDVGVFSLRMI